MMNYVVNSSFDTLSLHSYSNILFSIDSSLLDCSRYKNPLVCNNQLYRSRGSRCILIMVFIIYVMLLIVSVNVLIVCVVMFIACIVCLIACCVVFIVCIVGFIACVVVFIVRVVLCIVCRHIYRLCRLTTVFS